MVLDELLGVLIGTQRLYADADEDGWRIGEMEVDGHPEAVRLAPGVRIQNGAGGGHRSFARVGVHRTMRWAEAVTEGWVRLL